ncbi:uncharacterized protein SETTUDRAFT_109080 [Exserohilum turcica Et28A]|uniref:Uncharacterized protein n=1 Tax=Exserohilum turcicum (strain 28A) TaxID=671987 RepID=R0IT49_EXST2|nr:uncharacterized protein SETTUDRAFT_109080 [Exserohilum turcica Et28A]EOA87831.1 hypothetical protein SETTUDRAFT_109080 [Exserohilum turcica Et28A]
MLPSLPFPGLVLIPHLTAQTHQVLLLKSQDQLLGGSASSVHFVAPERGAKTPFLQVHEEQAGAVVFRTIDGNEAMRINVQRHSVYRHKTEYKAVRSSDAKVIWEVELKTGWRVPKYDLAVHEQSLPGKVEFKRDVSGEEQGIVVHGSPAATISRHEKWKHQHAEYIVYVAPGMDLLLALGMAWIVSDKQKQDDKVAVVL